MRVQTTEDYRERMGRSISEIGVKELTEAGLEEMDAERLYKELKDAIDRTGGVRELNPKELWREITAWRLLKPWYPHALHQLVYYAVYHNYDVSVHGPPLYWFPSL